MLRVPVAGGTARAYIHPRLDSVVWSAGAVPALERVLAFDPEEGVIAVVDRNGQPRRIDLRAGEVRLASRGKLTGLSSANGSDIYGIAASGEVRRLNASGDWKFEPPSPARWVFPQPNGTVVIAGNASSETHLWLIRPTDDDIIETASIPLVSRGVRTQVGDRIYFTADSGLMGVRTRDLAPVKTVALSGSVQSVVPTPSGDRIYVSMSARSELSVIDRYTEAATATVPLPGPAADLRMDPLGQYILARPASAADSAWVIDVSTNKVSGTVRTVWRSDLPVFSPGGTIATLVANDVVFLNATNLKVTQTALGGSKDFWYFFEWNGFRPRAADIDRPVTFETSEDMSRPADSTVPPGDTVRVPPLRDAYPSMIEPPAVTPRPAAYMVSFAAVLTRERAEQLAAEMAVNGVRPRVSETASGTTTLFRVVLGPFSSREEADRVGRDSRRQYWVYEDKQ